MKEIKKIILAYSHLPGLAHTNRMICFAKGYKAAGLEVVIVCLGLRGVDPFELDGIKVRFISEKKNSNKLLRRLIAEVELIHAIKKEYRSEDSVIHIYRTPHWAYAFNMKKFDFFLERGEVPFYAEVNSIFYNIQEWLGLKLSTRATGMLVQTHALKKYYSNYGVKHIDVNNMFVDTSRFNDLCKNSSEKYIAYCGNISRHKDGADDLIKAFKIVHSVYPEWKLKIIGGFERFYDDEEFLKGFVKELDLSGSVEFTGRVAPEKMPDLLYQARILALARPESEQAKYGFPTKVGEYLCTGNPCVLTLVGELGLYLKDRENCIFADPDNPTDFGIKLLWTIENYDESLKIAEKGRELVNTDFSMYNQSIKALKFMQRVVNLSQ